MGKGLVGEGLVGKDMRTHSQRAQQKRVGRRSSQERKSFLLGQMPMVKTIEESSQVKLRSFFPTADRGGIPKSLLFGSS